MEELRGRVSSALGTVASCSAKLEYRAKKLDDAFGELDRAKRAARDEGIDMKEFRSDFQVCMRMFLADQAVRKVLNHVGAESAGLSTESSLSNNLKAILRNVETTLTEAVDAGSVPEGVYLKVSDYLKDAYEVKDEPSNLDEAIHALRDETNDRIDVIQRSCGCFERRIYTSDSDDSYFEWQSERSWSFY